MINQELPFWSDHPRAKLFKRYIYASEMERPDGIKIKFENESYVSYHSFKWQLESSMSTEKVSYIKGLVENQSSPTIRSSTLLDIQEDDIVFLQSSVSSKGVYYIVNAVEQDYIRCPKMRKSLVHLSLSSIATESISVWE